MKSNITLTAETGMELTIDIDKLAIISQEKGKDNGSSVYVSGIPTDFKVMETTDEILAKIHKARCFEANEKVHVSELT